MYGVNFWKFIQIHQYYTMAFSRVTLSNLAPLLLNILSRGQRIVNSQFIAFITFKSRSPYSAWWTPAANEWHPSRNWNDGSVWMKTPLEISMNLKTIFFFISPPPPNFPWMPHSHMNSYSWARQMPSGFACSLRAPCNIVHTACWIWKVHWPLSACPLTMGNSVMSNAYK